MSKFFVLLRLQMMGVFGINKILHGKGSATSGKIALIVLAVIAVLGLGAFISWSFTLGFATIGATTILPAITLALASIMVFIFTYLRASGVLFGHKDYDQTMSLPVSAASIVLSRVIMIYLTMVVICAVVFVPAMVNYAAFADTTTASAFAMFALAIFIAPFIPMTLSILVGTAIVALTSRFRYANIIVIILALVLLAGYFYVIFAWQANMMVGLDEAFITGEITDIGVFGNVMTNNITNFYPPARWFVDGIYSGLWGGFGIFAAVSILVFAAYVFITARFYKAINTRLASKRKRSNYRLGELKANTAFSAMYKREIRRIPTSVIYAMNVVLGPLLLLAAAVALVAIGPSIITDTASFLFPGMTLDELTATTVPFLVFVPMFLGGIFPASCANLSLEGKNAWIMCSIPVPSKTIFASKMAMSLTLPLPTTIIFSIASIITMQPDFLTSILVLFVPAAYIVFNTALGMFMNAKLPKYDWDSEYKLLKGTGSAAVLVMTLTGMFSTIILIIFAVIFTSYIAIILLAVLAISVIGTILILNALSKQKLFVD